MPILHIHLGRLILARTIEMRTIKISAIKKENGHHITDLIQPLTPRQTVAEVLTEKLDLFSLPS